MDCAALLLSKPLELRSDPGHPSPPFTQVGVVVTSTAVRMVNSLKQDDEVKALISEVESIVDVPLPSKCRLPVAEILMHTEGMGLALQMPVFAASLLGSGHPCLHNHLPEVGATTMRQRMTLCRTWLHTF